MKLNPNFVLREIDDTAVLIPFGKLLVNFNGMLTLNKVGAFLAKNLQEETTLQQLVEKTVEKYNIDAQTAKIDVIAFLDSLRKSDLIIE